MRENRTSGSEGGGAKSIASPYPYQRSLERLSQKISLSSWNEILQLTEDHVSRFQVKLERARIESVQITIATTTIDSLTLSSSQ